jgi:thiamine pyrophosphokinase
MAAKVLGVLAGKDMPSDLLRRWAETADVVLAADEGADRLLEIGITPAVVVGDLDSTQVRNRLEELAKNGALGIVHDQDERTTDCDKLLEAVLSDGHTGVTLACIEGDQLDHMLATLHSAARSPLRVRAALRNGLGWVLRGGEEVQVRTEKGRRVSFLPLTFCEGAFLSNVEWPLGNSLLDPLGASSISNRATGDCIRAGLSAGAAVLFVEFPETELPLW